MKTSVTLAAALAALALASAAQAQDASKLAQTKGCLACHQNDKKLIGPSYKEVNAKYGKQKDAAAVIAKSIRAGSKGKWGNQVPMPPNTGVNEAEAQTLAKWILTIK
ncbi:MAG: c-type cytochrome [Burkholderiales bacterium]|nr:c-type cytochrome [Burkholderiales bacterium]